MDNTCKEAFILEYFKALRAEIDLRIKNHTTLVTWKVTVVGALLAFLLSQQPSTLGLSRSYGLLLAPLAAMLFDVMIAQNIHTINQLGVYIRDHLESRVNGIELWETRVAQRSGQSRCYGLIDVIVLCCLTLGTSFIVLYVLHEQKIGLRVPFCVLGVPLVFVVAIMWIRIIQLGLSECLQKLRNALSYLLLSPRRAVQRIRGSGRIGTNKT